MYMDAEKIGLIMMINGTILVLITTINFTLVMTKDLRIFCNSILVLHYAQGQKEEGALIWSPNMAIKQFPGNTNTNSNTNSKNSLVTLIIIIPW